jgi:thioredoxin reductase (NADPH)
MQHADVVVIGAGVAGLTAAMIAAGHGVSTVVVEQLAPGGQVATIEKIGNFPGFPDGIAGYELGPLLQQQAEAAGAVVQLDSVSEIVAGDGVYRVICAEDEITARAVIIAAGSSLRKLAISGEAEFAGRGVSHCASCDGPLFKGQSVVVAGGGDSAFDEALVLAGHGCEVIVVHRGSHPSARASAVAQLVALPHVRMVADSEVVAIEGDTKVTGVAIRRGAGTEHQPCRAIFAYIGLEPRSGFLRDLVATDAEGHIVTDAMMRASLPGLFAAGDIRAGSVRMLASVAGDAATAAISAVRYLQAAHENNNTDWEGDDFGVAERSRTASGR